MFLLDAADCSDCCVHDHDRLSDIDDSVAPVPYYYSEALEALESLSDPGMTNN